MPRKKAKAGRKKKGTITKSVRITEEQGEWLRDFHISLSGVVQAYLDELMEAFHETAERGLPTQKPLTT